MMADGRSLQDLFVEAVTATADTDGNSRIALERALDEAEALHAEGLLLGDPVDEAALRRREWSRSLQADAEKWQRAVKRQLVAGGLAGLLHLGGAFDAPVTVCNAKVLRRSTGHDHTSGRTTTLALLTAGDVRLIVMGMRLDVDEKTAAYEREAPVLLAQADELDRYENFAAYRRAMATAQAAV